MFSDWKQEKATAGLVAEAQAVADRLAGAKPHHVEAHAAAARFWAAAYLAEGQDLHLLADWPAADRRRFTPPAPWPSRASPRPSARCGSTSWARGRMPMRWRRT